MANQIVVSAGAKVRNLQDVIIGTSGVLTSLGFDVANGVPRLDVNGKILVSQLPNSVMEYKGTWNISTNTPTLVNGTGNQGDVYLVEGAAAGGTSFNFGAGAILFFNGDQAIYSGSIWQRASGATGTVTSVAVTESGDSLNITGSPITTSGTINIGFNGTNLQYVNGAGNLTTFPTLITSIGLSMPSAFSVANSPLTANGTIAVTGAGVASQYIRGDGTLADFPSSGGGGSSVSYYLNGGTSQGTIGGTTYYEMSKTADTGTGVDFAKSGDGFIVAFLTDANDPAQLNIPAGNWNYEIYASMSANGGTPQMYAELYKYDGTTFTLISTSSNEILYDGTNLNLYTFGMTVPATTLALTDRLAIKLYATNSGGKTTTVHTQDSHLCQVITTFSTGITALNGLTAQVQYFQVGTSGTDFNISSATATHTFNIPDASATARGLITTGTQTIAGTKTFSDATKNNGGIFLQNASSSSLAGYMNLGGLTNGVKFTSGGGISNSFTLPSATGYTFTFPNATGTIALTSDIPSITGLVPYTGATGSVNLGAYLLTASGVDSVGYTARGSGTLSGYLIIKQGTTYLGNVVGYNSINANARKYVFISDVDGTNYKSAIFELSSLTNNTDRTYTFPDASGTIALVGGSGVGTVTSVAALTIGTSGTDLSSTVATSTTTPVITLNVPTASATNRGALSSADWSTFNSKQGTITLTTTGTSGAATFSSNTLNIPQYQSALTNPVTGTGNNNYIAKFTSTGSTIGNSIIQDASTYIDVAGYAFFRRSGKFLIINPNYNAASVYADIAAEAGMDLSLSANGATKQLYLTQSGNLGLGVTPSAWESGFTVIQQNTKYFNAADGSANYQGINAYYNAGWKYIATGTSQYFQQYNGGFAWLQAPSGTAGNAITFTQAMTLTASGSLLIGDTTSPSNNKLYVKGSVSENGLSIRSGGNGGTYLFRVAYALGTEGSAFLINDNERVLIGTTTDAGYKLDVNGTGRFSSTDASYPLTLSSTVSAANQNYLKFAAGGTTIGSIYRPSGTNAVAITTNYEALQILNGLAVTGAATFSSTVGVGGAISGWSTVTFPNIIQIGSIAVTSNGTNFGQFSNNIYYNGSAYKYIKTAGAGRFIVDSDGSMVFENAASGTGGATYTGTERFRISSTGAATFSSSVTATSFFESSDSRLKTLIQDNYQTKGIASITPKLYTKNGKVELGYYAQDFVGVLDSAISKGSDDMLSLSYREVLVAKVYALEQEIKDLKAKMN